MRRYELQDVIVQREVEAGRTCDGCGVAEDDAEFGLVEVVIAVNEGGNFGGRDDLDYCNDCLIARAPALVAAGSTAEIVQGEPVLLSVATLPAEIVALVNARAGREHSGAGRVLAAVAEVLNLWEQLNGRLPDHNATGDIDAT